MSTLREMTVRAPNAKHVRKLSKPWTAVRHADLREHGVWAVDSGRRDDGLWICPLVSEPPLGRLFLDWFAPVFVGAIFEFADGSFPRGLICPSEDADDLDLDPAVFGVDGSLVRLVVRSPVEAGVAEACARLERTIDQVMPLRVAATVECGRRVVSERRMPGFPVAVRDRRVPVWMQDGTRCVGPG